MEGLERVLCLCPGSRLSLTSLVLSTWETMRSCTLVEDEPSTAQVQAATSVVVMDRFVQRDLVERLLAHRPVFVLAWNGLFEILRYKEILDGLDVTYVGPDETLQLDVRYAPMIDGTCSFARWRRAYADKRVFRAVGSRAYQLRWLRTRIMDNRLMSVGAAAANAVRRPRALVRTLQSGVLRERLVWAGFCSLDPSIGLSPDDERSIVDDVAAIRRLDTPDERLRAGLALVASWRARATPETAHQVFFVVNTLVRWSVLAYLLDTARPATWFFGRSNLGLDLELELYVHNLVPPERTVFLELGGTKTGDVLYPRALHLLSREYYVISIAADGTGDVQSTLSELRRELTIDRSAFFDRIEGQREALYRNLPANATLADAHRRVWSDFDVSRRRL